MITVEERLKRIESQLDRIADALEEMNKRQRIPEKEVTKTTKEKLVVYLDSLEESD